MLKTEVNAGRIDVGELTKDVPSLRQYAEENFGLKVKEAYEKLLSDNNLNPHEYEPRVTIGEDGTDFVENKMTVIVHAIKKPIKIAPND